MKELDFDELDRAVNTLMGGVSPGAPARSDDDTRVITIPSTLENTATPVMPRFTSPNRLAPSAAPSNADASTPQSASAAPERASSDAPSRLTIPSRRAGRFMDVVHPSSDMKNPSNAPSERPSRTAMPVEPLASSDVVVQDVPGEPVVEAETVAYESIAEPDTIAETAADLNLATASSEVDSNDSNAVIDTVEDWPDPLAGFGAEVTSAVISSDEPAISVLQDEDEVGDDDLFTIDTTEPDDEPQPLVSPFLVDAKVEKRPLGTAIEVSSDDDGEPGRAPVLGVFAETSMTNSNPDDQLPPEPADIAPVLPAELQTDLIAVESDNTSFVASEVSEVDTVTSPTQASESPAELRSTTSTGPTSIQQQYKESATTGDQTNGAIYDTQAYHKPLAHPAKKKSGWMWVVWVLLLLIVGAGSAVALYYFKLI